MPPQAPVGAEVPRSHAAPRRTLRVRRIALAGRAGVRGGASTPPPLDAYSMR
ncbi:MAG: hypothetical protein IAE83_17705 [Anaerolinea sp.]|nr:hypothetical protein [Anaerolinea sp.]